MASILVIDGDRAQVEALATELTIAGHDVSQAIRGDDGLRRIRDDGPDLVLIDASLQDVTGTEVVRAVRADSAVRNTPIVMLSERGDEIDRVVAFEVGVDDFVKKPYSVRELALRCRAILRRRRMPEKLNGMASVGGLELDPVAHRVSVAGDDVPLSALEFKLLATLYQRRSRVQSRSELLSEVWGATEGVSVRTVDACVKRLRQKLGDAGRYVQTVRGVGYRFIASDELSDLG
jgi:two-component system phosphate regulon response regulator PhoB